MTSSRCSSMRILSVFAVVMLFPGIILAQEGVEKAQDKNNQDQELRELLAMTVESASKKEESIMTAPAVISILTANEIRDFGIQSVSEAVGIITGVFLYDSYLTNYNQLAIRSNFGAEHYNTKILLMVNGHPVYYTVHGGFEVNMIPIEAVERIEVIRGPVSVMYGTNALTGTINIITRREPEFLNGEFRYQYGSFNTHEFRLSAGKSYNDFRYFFSGTYRHQDGYDLVVRPDQDEAGRGFSHKQYANFGSLFASLVYKDLEIDLAYWDQQHPSKLGIVPHFFFQNDIFDQNMMYADVRYSSALTENAKLSFKLRLDSCDYYWEPEGINLIDKTAASPSIATAQNKKYGSEVYLDTNPHDQLNIFAGVMYDRYTSSAYTFSGNADNPVANFSPYTADKSTSDLAAYVNFSYQLSEPINIVGGIRGTENSATGGHVDFRLGSILQLKYDLFFKILYGTSYRSPNFFELFTSSEPILRGNNNLDFETMNGLDAVLYYNYKNRLTISGTFFWNRTNDFITRRVRDGVPTYVNTEGHEASGIEFELKYNLLNKATIFLNSFNIIGSKDLEVDEELRFIIKSMINFGISYKIDNRLTISSHNSYRGRWAESEAYFISNLTARYRLPGIKPGKEIFIAVYNLFDAEYTFAEFSRGRIETIPGGPPRSVTGGVIFSF